MCVPDAAIFAKVVDEQFLKCRGRLSLCPLRCWSQDVECSIANYPVICSLLLVAAKRLGSSGAERLVRLRCVSPLPVRALSFCPLQAMELERLESASSSTRDAAAQNILYIALGCPEVTHTDVRPDTLPPCYSEAGFMPCTLNDMNLMCNAKQMLVSVIR